MVPVIPRRSKPRTAFRTFAARWACWIVACVLLIGAAGARAASVDEEEALRGPDIVIIAEPERTIYEFRQSGELRMVRIEPRFGKPYYLVPRDNTRGFGNLERADMLLPSWVILEF
jgi:hypothetical protein